MLFEVTGSDNVKKSILLPEIRYELQLRTYAQLGALKRFLIDWWERLMFNGVVGRNFVRWKGTKYDARSN